MLGNEWFTGPALRPVQCWALNAWLDHDEASMVIMYAMLETPTTFGDEHYAAEELVAELGAAMLCAHCGIDGDLRHAGYIESWLKALRNDKRYILTASAQAQKALDLLTKVESIEESEELAA